MVKTLSQIMTLGIFHLFHCPVLVTTPLEEAMAGVSHDVFGWHLFASCVSQNVALYILAINGEVHGVKGHLR